MAEQDTLVGLTGDDRIVAEAKERFNRCEAWEAKAQKNFIEDLKFANADPDNNWQWDEQLRTYRQDRKKPCLTINKVRQHNLQIINDAKQNKPGVNVRPVGDGATYDAAQVFEGVVRHIEYQSNAEVAYDTASTFQVEGGIGYWRVVTDYVSNTSFDQELFIRRIKRPDSVYLDPDISEVDGSDARFGFIFEDKPRDEFNKEYPDYKDDAGMSVLGQAGSDWIDEDHVRVCEYYTKEQKKDALIAFLVPPTVIVSGLQPGQQIVMPRSKMPPEIKALYEEVKAAAPDAVTEREILTDEVMWYKIAGAKIIDRRPWLGKYIPIVRVIGEETIIEGKLDRKGHTRAMKDAQRMYNYWTSEATAQVALQTKTPWVAPAEAIENLEEYWGRANIDEVSVLPYNQFTEDGKPLQAPVRTQPAILASAYVQGMQITQNEMMMASGQYQSQFGQNENATSGKAINERQRQGDNATYHFIDNLAIGIRFTGKILIDAIPKYYDTPRIIRILAKDGTESHVQLDPQAQAAYAEGQQQEAQQVQAIFNPNVGRYEVESDVGPAYATRRQEAFNAMTQIAAQNKDFMQIGGDLMWKAADFPMADELSERWAKTIPANIKGDGPSPAEQQLQGKLKQAEDAIVLLQKKLDNKQLDYALRIDQKNIDANDSMTKRLVAEGNAGPYVTQEQVQPLIMQTIMDMLRNPIQGAPQTALQGGPSEPGLPMLPEQPLPAPGAAQLPAMGVPPMASAA